MPFRAWLITYSDLFTCLNWGRKGQQLISMPAEKFPIARAFLEFQIRKLRGETKGRKRGGASAVAPMPGPKQEQLFRERPESDSKKKPN